MVVDVVFDGTVDAPRLATSPDEAPRFVVKLDREHTSVLLDHMDGDGAILKI